MTRIESWNVDRSWTLLLDHKSTINSTKTCYKYIAELSHLFARSLFITNQPEVEFELLTHEELLKEHNQTMQLIEYFGGHIDAFYYDINDPNFDTFSSKPNPGMAYQAKRDFSDIDFKKTIVLGSEIVDMEFGKRLNMKTVWLEKKISKQEELLIRNICDISVADLESFLHLFI